LEQPIAKERRIIKEAAPAIKRFMSVIPVRIDSYPLSEISNVRNRGVLPQVQWLYIKVAQQRVRTF